MIYQGIESVSQKVPLKSMLKKKISAWNFGSLPTESSPREAPGGHAPKKGFTIWNQRKKGLTNGFLH